MNWESYYHYPIYISFVNQMWTNELLRLMYLGVIVYVCLCVCLFAACLLVIKTTPVLGTSVSNYLFNFKLNWYLYLLVWLIFICFCLFVCLLPFACLLACLLVIKTTPVLGTGVSNYLLILNWIDIYICWCDWFLFVFVCLFVCLFVFRIIKRPNHMIYISTRKMTGICTNLKLPVCVRHSNLLLILYKGMIYRYWIKLLREFYYCNM